MPDARRERDQALADFHELARWQVKPPSGCGTFICPPQPIYDLLDQGQTPEDIAAVLRKAAERIDAGDLEARLWGAPLLKGWYGPIRDEQPIGRGGKPKRGPVVETVEEARRHFAEHGRLPDGWGWHDDGRGNHTPVQAKGGAA